MDLPDAQNDAVGIWRPISLAIRFRFCWRVAPPLPGCLSYIVAKDASDPNAIWITEAWDSKARHEASLSLPSVKEAIAKGRPLIAAFADQIVTTLVGGTGLARTDRPR